MKPKAIILTDDMYDTAFAKTAHGLVRTSDKYQIIGIWDTKFAGKEAGTLLDGKNRNIPIYGNFAQIKSKHSHIDYAIIGVATPGGIIPDAMQNQLLELLENGISIVNGLHTFLADIPKFADKAKENNCELLDIRREKLRSELAFWTGDIFQVTCPIIAVLGTDCALGKRTTTRLLVDALKEKSIHAEMIFTGQTGMIQNDSYGFVFDSTINDFVSGELENAIVQCFKNRKPDIILLEGQASLFNPSGPCGSEYLISGNAKKVILQHAPGRKYYEGWEHLELEIPPIEKTIQLIELYDSEVIGIALNAHTEDGHPRLSREAIEKWEGIYEKQFGLPVIDPVYDNLEPFIQKIETLLK